jgi:hypothetical protein
MRVLGSPLPPYPYGGTVFTEFILDSYRFGKKVARPTPANAMDFYKGMDVMLQKPAVQKFLASHILQEKAWREKTWTQIVAAFRQEREGATSPAARRQLEEVFLATLHKTIKTEIPTFSLEEGFEFCNAIDKGKRQCFSQSVLIAGLLQAAGMDAGVVMVWKSETGQVSNNGHAITLTTLADGSRLFIDASEQHPYAIPQGVFMACVGKTNSSEYRFVRPILAKGDIPIVERFTEATRNEGVQIASLTTVSVAFLKSQFDYYRGERTTNGIMTAKPSPVGIKEADLHLTRGVQICPQNPLAFYQLARVRYRLGERKDARDRAEKSYRLYTRYGYVPEGVQELYDLTRKRRGR